MIYITDSISIPAGYFGEYRYTEACIEDLKKVIDLPQGEVETAIVFPYTYDLISVLSEIEIDRILAINTQDDLFGAYRPSIGDKALIIRYGRWAVMGRFGNPDSMMREILSLESSPTKANLKKYAGDIELGWLEYVDKTAENKF